ncbi:MAG: hypothetical protein ACRDV3_08400 [Acidothermaceae bacterium]
MTQHRNDEVVRGWFTGRLPSEWFVAAPEIAVDREEITVIGEILAPALGADASEGERKAAWAGRIKAFREDTRGHRMEIADEAEHRFGRKVAWGAACGERKELFTNLSIPVMTRLRQRDRIVLDTLVDAGVARSRSDALAWSVRLVGKHADEWLGQLRDAMRKVEEVRDQGPSTS